MKWGCLRWNITVNELLSGENGWFGRWVGVTDVNVLHISKAYKHGCKFDVFR